MNDGVVPGAEVDQSASRSASKTATWTSWTDDLDQALELAWTKATAGEAAVDRPAAATRRTCCRECSMHRERHPDVLTDQTSAHDMLNGYVPERHDLRCRRWRCATPTPTLPRRVAARRASTCGLMLQAAAAGGGHLRLRQQHARPRPKTPASRTPSTIPGLRAGVHPAAVLRGARARSLGGALGAIPGHRAHRPSSCSRCSPRTSLCRWIELARERVAFQGLPSRICWLGYGERDRFGVASTSSWPRARSARRSSLVAITWTAAAWRARIARPKR
jgi:urocanate hydratase